MQRLFQAMACGASTPNIAVVAGGCRRRLPDEVCAGLRRRRHPTRRPGRPGSRLPPVETTCERSRGGPSRARPARCDSTATCKKPPASEHQKGPPRWAGRQMTTKKRLPRTDETSRWLAVVHFFCLQLTFGGFRPPSYAGERFKVVIPRASPRQRLLPHRHTRARRSARPARQDAGRQLSLWPAERRGSSVPSSKAIPAFIAPGELALPLPRTAR